MVVTYRTEREYLRAKVMKELFSNLENGTRNGLTLREIANAMHKKLTNTDDNNPLKKLKPESLIRYIRGALDGGEFKDQEFQGLDPNYLQRINNKKTEKVNRANVQSGRYKIYEPKERKFILDLYQKERLEPEEIARLHAEQKEFPPRNKRAIDDFIRRNIRGFGIRSRNNWGEIGKYALALLAYGRERDYLVLNSKILNQFLYGGTKEIDRTKLGNFYKRNKELCDLIVEEAQSLHRFEQRPNSYEEIIQQLRFEHL